MPQRYAYEIGRRLEMTQDDPGGRVLVLQHLAAEGPGSIGEHLAAVGMQLTVIELDEGDLIPPLSEFDLMLAMGGPMDVWDEDRYPWMSEEKIAIRQWVSELQRPYVGVCLGHQLLADALGGHVGTMAEPEIGVMEIDVTPEGLRDPLFSRVPSPLRGLQWHGAQVLRLPPAGVLLATNPYCHIQALRVGPCAWGVQFHLEVSETTVPEWERVPEYQATLEMHGRSEADWLRNDVVRHLPRLRRDMETLVSPIIAKVQQGHDSREAAVP
jgi:GMP synthase-like glutamine amidotransferase